MTTLTQTFGAGEPLTYEVPYYSRKEVTILSGQDLAANTVLGRATVSAAIAVPSTANAGNGAMGAITLGKDAVAGVYKLVVLEPGSNVGDFGLYAPDGKLVAIGTVASAFVSTHMSFTLADDTDFAGGDVFSIYTNAVAGVPGSNTGTGTLAVAQYEPWALSGVYTLTCTAAASNAGTFSVVGPDGVDIGPATVGVEFRGGGLRFTITDDTDFIVGDTFTITIAAGKYKAWNPTNTDGSSRVAGILLHAVDATAGDVQGTAIVRHASVNPAELTYYSGATEGAKRDALGQLAALGITTR